MLSCMLSVVIAVAVEGRKDSAGPRCGGQLKRSIDQRELYSSLEGTVRLADDILSRDLGNEGDMFAGC